MKRNFICFSGSRDISITGLSCADTEEESDQKQMSLVTMVWMTTTTRVLVAVGIIMQTMEIAMKLSKQSGHISSRSVTTCYQDELQII